MFEVALLAGGCGAVATSVAWWAGARLRERRELGNALRDPDPRRRREAVQRLGQRGIAAFADMVLASAASETDPTVLEAVAAAVTQSQWEPSYRRALVQLRMLVLERLGGAASGAPGGSAEQVPGAPVPRELPTSGSAGAGVQEELRARIEAALGEQVTHLCAHGPARQGGRA